MEQNETEYLESIGVTIMNQEMEVFEKDYDLVVKNPGVPPVSPIVKRLNERNIPIITEIELGFQLAKPQNYIAITGSNGKTTTTTIMYELLKAGFPLSLINNKFKELCIKSSDGMSKRRLIIQALNENVELDHIKTAINSNDFQKLEKLINEAKGINDNIFLNQYLVKEKSYSTGNKNKIYGIRR